MFAIPYFTIHSLKLFGPVALQPFGVCVAVGVLLAVAVSRRHAEQMGIDDETHRSYMMWLLVPGFIGAHVFDVLFYENVSILHHPLVLFKVWSGISSYGGILGALFGMLYFTRRHHYDTLSFAEAAGWGLLPGWIFGRMGCSIVHDHPGIPTHFPLAINFPASYAAHYGIAPGPRLDLGFLEFLYLIFIFLLLLVITRKKRPVGFVIAYVCIMYGSVRFFLEFFRINSTDPRYFGLTFAQYVSAAAVPLGIFLMVRAYKRAPRPAIPEGAVPIGGGSSGSAGGDSGGGKRSGGSGGKGGTRGGTGGRKQGNKQGKKKGGKRR